MIVPNSEFDPEPCPKWKVLSDILRSEIPADIKENASERADNSQKVLILCHNPKTCVQIYGYLREGHERFLFRKAMKNGLDLPKISKNYSTFDVKPIRCELMNDDVRKNPNGDFEKPVEFDDFAMPPPKGKALLESISKPQENDKDAIEDDLKTVLDNEQDDDDLNNSCYVFTFSQKCPANDKTNNKPDKSVDALFESFTEMENLDLSSITEDKPIVCIYSLNAMSKDNMSLEKLLNEMRPSYVIMYEISVAAIRQIEVYEARLQRAPVDRTKVFFLIHNGTVEEQSYLTNLRREKQAFEMLIETKRTMVVPEYQDGKTDGCLALQRELRQKSPQKNTRQAGGQDEILKPEEAPRIIVDMREFRSDLPCLIHRRGIQVDPVTITIGDYILTPEICVERKSISDLIGSLNSGRLYTQCVQMTRNYSKPMLLIEFEQNGSFNLQGHHLVAGENSSLGTMQKLQLLTVHFPKLRIVWSPSPYATAQLFEELKQGKEQPDAKLAAVIGTDDDTVDMEFITDNYNSGIHDFLMKLPGINSKNIRRIMNHGESLDKLIKMNKEELVDLLGNSKDAELFWDIAHLNHVPVPESKKPTFAERKLNAKARRGRKKFM